MKRILVALLMAMTVLASGCGENGDKEKLNVMLGSNVNSLDVAQATELASFEVISNCVDGLLQLDEQGKAVPAIAESYEVSADGKTYTFHLRDAKWSNGDPVTAQDFVFAWRRQCEMAEEYSYMLGSTVACIRNADQVIKGDSPENLGVSAPDSRTFVVELEAPVNFFPELMSFPVFFPINEKFYKSLEEGTYGITADTFLSNGAFRLVDYLPGTASISFEKNESYWDADRVSLKRLHYQVVSSSDNALTAFRNGTLQMIQLKGTHVSHVKQDPELSKLLTVQEDGSLFYLSYNQDPKNHHAGALSNVNLRRALSKVIDRESLTENYVMDGAKPDTRAVPLNFAKNRNTGVYFAEDQNKYAEYEAYDVEAGLRYLKKAQEELGREQFNLQMVYSNDSGDTIVRVVQAIKSQVEAALPGVILELQPVPKAEYFSKISSNSFDLAVMNWTPDYDDPMTFLTQWTTDSSKITEHWSNAAYDNLIKECSSGAIAGDYDARWKAMNEAEGILLENAVITPLYTGVNAFLIADNVKGIELHSVGVPRVFKYVKIQ